MIKDVLAYVGGLVTTIAISIHKGVTKCLKN